METLTTFEALELIRLNESAMRELFEYWLSITFATIVAAFAGREQLTRVMRVLGAVLYILASVTLVSSWVVYGGSNIELAELLSNRGAPQEVPLISGIGYVVLVLLGIGTTLYFIFSNWSSGGDT